MVLTQIRKLRKRYQLQDIRWGEVRFMNEKLELRELKTLLWLERFFFSLFFGVHTYYAAIYNLRVHMTGKSFAKNLFF